MLIDHYIWNKNCVKLLDWFSYLFFREWIFKARTGKFCAPIRAVSLSFPQVGIWIKAHKAWRVWRLRCWRLTSHRVCGEQMKGVSDDARRIKTQRKGFGNNKSFTLHDKTGSTHFGNREGEWKRRPSCLMSLLCYYRRSRLRSAHRIHRLTHADSRGWIYGQTWRTEMDRDCGLLSDVSGWGFMRARENSDILSRTSLAPSIETNIEMYS